MSATATLEKNYQETSKKCLCIVLRSLLEDAGINSYEFSKRTSIPYSSVSRMLNKPFFSPSVGTLKIVADYFNISIEQLIGDKPIEKLKYVESILDDLKPSITHPKLDRPCNYKLLMECIKLLESYTIRQNKAFNLDKSFRIIKEIYEFSFVKNLDSPDKDFSEWLLEKS